MTSASTRRMQVRRRWLVRRGGVDYGPYDTEQVLEAIARREVDLSTLTCDVVEQHWEPVGAHALFREHFAQCEKRWQVEAAHEEADDHLRKMKAARALKGGTWRLLIVGGLIVLGGGGWLTWRLMHAQPTGIMGALAVPVPAALPATPPLARAPAPLPAVAATAVPRLKEPVNYDTAGVSAGDPTAPLVTRLDFDDEGGGAGGGRELSAGELKGISEAARKGLVRCAQEAATRSSTFTGTTVTFVVRPRRLGSFTVGKEVRTNQPFKACVKRVLSGIPVPDFQGSERRVTIPLQVRR